MRRSSTYTGNFLYRQAAAADPLLFTLNRRPHAHSNSQNVKYYGIVKNILKFSEGFIIIYKVLKIECVFESPICGFSQKSVEMNALLL